MPAPRWARSNTPARMTQNHPHAVRPKPGMNRITYIRVANGKKMMPSRGTSQVLKAAETSAGLATQTMNSASRGKSPANIANRQPIERSLHQDGGGRHEQMILAKG